MSPPQPEGAIGLMSDEQMIYIGPEEDLTQVRQKLEAAKPRRVTLVLTPQTQLRSHVAWKLLHARARELGKDVLIISSDPQVRSVAQAVKFKVATSLEASRSGKSRPPTRPSRSGNAAKDRAQGSTRGTSKRNQPDSRSLQSPRASQSDQGSSWFTPTVEPSSSQPEPVDEAFTNDGVDEPRSSSSLDPTDRLGRQFEPPYDYRITVPPLRSVTPDLEDEADDSLLHDFNQAQSIRNAAMGENNAEPPTDRLSAEPPSSDRGPAPQERPSVDPFAHMDDASQPPPRKEQRGSVSIEGFATSEHPASQAPIHDISERPTDIYDAEVEYLGEDQGSQDYLPQDSFTSPITGPWFEANPVDVPGAPKSPPYQERVRSDDDLPPIEDRPTAVTPRRPSRPMSPQNVPPVRRPSAPLDRRNVPPTPITRGQPALSRPAPQPARPMRSVAPSRGYTGASRAGAGAASRSRAAARSRSLGGYTFGLIVILGLVLLGCLAYFGPSATVTLTVPARDYSHAVKLAVVSRGSTPVPGSVVADTVTKEFTKSGTGKATGTKTIDTAPAGGSVVFTNSGTKSVTIPVNTVVTTSGGKQFATTYEAVVGAKGDQVGNTILVPVVAQQPGVSGNVDSGTIVVIPDTSLAQIAQANNLSSADLRLQVNNAAPTTGGGQGTAKMITAADLTTTTKDLQASLNDQIQAWKQQQNTATQQVVGDPMIQSSLVNPTSPGGVLTDTDTFVAQLKAIVTVYVVHKADLQTATVAQLNILIGKEKGYEGYIINADPARPVSMQTITTSGTGKNLTLNFTATARAVYNLDQQQVKGLIVGKTKNDAATILKAVPNVQQVSIQISPGFVSFIPFWAPHITVKLVAGNIPPATQPKK